MRLPCPRCQTHIPLIPDRIPDGLFLVTCSTCRTVLAAELIVRTAQPYTGDGEPATPGAPPGPQAPPPSAEAPLDSGAARLRELVLKLLRGDRDEIPVLNRVALRVRRLIQDPRRHAAEIAAIIRQDQALASRLIRLANSAFYGARERVGDIDQAMQRVGYQAMESLMVAACTQNLFRPHSPAEAEIMAGLWDHAVAVAVAAKWIARGAARGDPERAFLAGLVHDIGRTLGLKVLSEAAARAQGERKTLPPARMVSLIGAHHAELGGLLLEKWAFPPDVVLAARAHHTPLDLPGDDPLPAMVSLADLVVRKAGLDIGAGGSDDPAWDRLVALLGLSDATLASLQVELEDLQAEMKQLLAA